MNQVESATLLRIAAKRIADLEQQTKQLQASNKRLREFRRSVLQVVEQVKGLKQPVQPNPLKVHALNLADLFK